MTGCFRLWVLLAAILFVAVAVAAGAASWCRRSKVDTIVWTQFGFGDQPMLIARALVGKGGDCPTIEIGGQRGTMQLRDDPRSAACSAGCARSKQPLERRSLDVRVLPGQPCCWTSMSRASRRSVLVLGDTGCRVTSFYDQVCSDAQKWPFSRVATAAADASRPS